VLLTPDILAGRRYIMAMKDSFEKKEALSAISEAHDGY
jgi:hypothetical protein